MSSSTGIDQLRSIEQQFDRERESVVDLRALEDIRTRYLSRKAGLLTSRRGVGGGYQLRTPASLMTLSDILAAIDGPLQPMVCTPLEPGGQLKTACECGTPGGCGAGRVFTDLQTQMHTFLSRITLADIVAREGGVMQFDI